jgi:DNA-binding cell septation regulator SpoVG
VRIDFVTVRDFRIFKKNGGKPFVQAPYNTLKKDGRIQFHPIIDLPEEIRAAVDAAILNEYFRKREESNEQKSK